MNNIYYGYCVHNIIYIFILGILLREYYARSRVSIRPLLPKLYVVSVIHIHTCILARVLNNTKVCIINNTSKKYGSPLAPTYERVHQYVHT